MYNENHRITAQKYIHDILEITPRRINIGYSCAIYSENLCYQFLYATNVNSSNLINLELWTIHQSRTIKVRDHELMGRHKSQRVWQSLTGRSTFTELYNFCRVERSCNPNWIYISHLSHPKL